MSASSGKSSCTGSPLTVHESWRVASMDWVIAAMAVGLFNKKDRDVAGIARLGSGGQLMPGIKPPNRQPRLSFHRH
jgi:hypothetical protein